MKNELNFNEDQNLHTTWIWNIEFLSKFGIHNNQVTFLRFSKLKDEALTSCGQLNTILKLDLGYLVFRIAVSVWSEFGFCEVLTKVRVFSVFREQAITAMERIAIENLELNK